MRVSVLCEPKTNRTQRSPKTFQATRGHDRPVQGAETREQRVGTGSQARRVSGILVQSGWRQDEGYTDPLKPNTMAGEQRLWPLIVRTGRCRNTSVPGIFLIRFDNEEEHEHTHTHTHAYFSLSVYVAVLISSSAADPGKNMKKAIGKMFRKYDWHWPNQQMRPSTGQHSTDHGLHELLASKKKEWNYKTDGQIPCFIKIIMQGIF